MKASFIALALSLALSAAAAPQTSQHQVRQFGNFGNNRGGFGGGGFFGGKNGGGRNNNGGNNNNNNQQNGGGAAGANNGAATGGNNGTATGGNNGAATGGNNSTATDGNNANGGAAAGNNSTNTGNNSQDAQTSTTLDPKVIATGFENDGQDQPTEGQVASLTSSNNFINFCLTVPNLPITNGKQITTGSCNPAPMGVLPSTDNMPSSKFVFPKNGATIKENTAFTITMAIQGMQTGFFVNAQENYFAAPQFLNANGQIQGHSHVVVEQLTAIDQTTPTNPKVFAFFKGLNAAAANGQLTADVTSGLPAGVYKLSSINSAANHQPVLVPIAQHGSLDDAVYFSVTADGQPDASSGVINGGSNSTAAGNTGAANGGAAAGNTGAANGGAAAGNTGAANGGGAAGNTGATKGGAAAGNTGATKGGAAAGNTGATKGGAAAGNTGATKGGAAAGNTGKNNQNNNQNNTKGNQNNGGRGGRNRRFARSRL
ncbi:hypothetical protein NP233_g8735 [Leucocoprinus birnbaumii]|uniref:Uncharacterized protein n=1 Tax=Leucocoprinus birnbaumii TaxID=56174 RepID=A0AAD5VLZ4_9AGAR|nr:hypothetical protein NP233_g8735 [Leucocoprinus birnbaumii]